MSLGEAVVHIWCDKCNTEEQVSLTSLAQRGSYDMRNVPATLKRWGWVEKSPDRHWCPECVADEQDSVEELDRLRSSEGEES